MSDDIKSPTNRLSAAGDGKFFVFWRGQGVYTADGRLRYLDTEGEGWGYLVQCDSASRVIGYVRLLRNSRKITIPRVQTTNRR